jgi:hypothetical protein
MKTLITYFIDNSTSEDYLFLLGFITLAVTIIRTCILLNNTITAAQLSTFIF